MAERTYARSIELPTEKFFRNLQTARRFAIDIGGSLAKLAYSSTVQRKTSLVFDDEANQEDGSIYQVSEQDEIISRLHFIKFETKFIESCLDFIKNHQSRSTDAKGHKSIKVTGGGAYKYTDLINSKLELRVDKEDEMTCLIKGCNFLLKNIPDEVFVYQRHGSSEYRFLGVEHNIFPYLLVNIGSGVSLVKVESESQFERIGGTSTGGGTFWGLGSLLTKAKTFDELLVLAENGDHRTVDMLVKDIYGGSYSKIGLPGEVIASSFGKAARPPKDQKDDSQNRILRQSANNIDDSFKESDIARSLLLSISNDIGQIAYLHAKLHGLKKIYFGGYFIRGHSLTMHTITYAINFWSKGEIQPLFLRHEGYLGAIGAFLKGAEEEDAEKYSWEENFAGSSGLSSPKRSSLLLGQQNSIFDMLELDRLAKPLVPCPLLLDPNSYLPDTEDLTEDQGARDYWIPCFMETVHKQEEQAIKSQITFEDSKERAGMFKEKYLQRLEELKKNPHAYGSLTVRSLLDMRSHCLQEFNFTDPYSQQKQMENEHALKTLAEYLQDIDKITDKESRLLKLARGLLAGNVFDWGAKEVVDMMEKDNISFSDAENKLQDRPWLIDTFDEWKTRLVTGRCHKCAAVFCDNSGADIILGIFPFARDLLQRGTKVIICANSKPTLNDVTYQELIILVKRVAQICPIIQESLNSGALMVMESGQGSPCLDLRHIDNDLVELMKSQEADLIVIEGMGRAIHTNFNAAFKCDSLKVAVLKNKWLANRLGGSMFSVIFKYEKSKKVDINGRR